MPLEITTTQQPETTAPEDETRAQQSEQTTSIKYASEAERRALAQRMRLLDEKIRRISAYSSILRTGALTPESRTNIADLIDGLQQHRSDISNAVFGPGSYSQYEDYVNRCVDQSSQGCTEAKKVSMRPR